MQHVNWQKEMKLEEGEKKNKKKQKNKKKTTKKTQKKNTLSYL